MITQSTRHGPPMGTEIASHTDTEDSQWEKNICSIPPVFHAEWECVSSSRGLSSYYNKTIITTEPCLNTGIQGFHVYKTKTLNHKSSACYFHFFSIKSENNPYHVPMMPDLFSKLGHWDHEQKAWRCEVYHVWVSHWDRVKLDTIELHHGKVEEIHLWLKRIIY